MATRRNPEEPKALQVSVPSKKAAAIPESDNPVTKSGEPKEKMIILLSKADCHVGGEDWINWIALSTIPRSDTDACAFIDDLWWCLGFKVDKWGNWSNGVWSFEVKNENFGLWIWRSNGSLGIERVEKAIFKEVLELLT